MLALSPLVVEYALYLGTDMPFAAACVLAVTLLMQSANRKVQSTEHQQSTIYNLQSAIVVAAGLAAGAAFLIRHPGLLLLPFGWLVILGVKRSGLPRENPTSRIQHPTFLLIFTLAFFLAISPQLYVNLRDTGSPFFSQQAKNVWQGVYGDGDWERWATTGNDITIGRVIAQDPARFLTNWWANVRGYIGTGGEDTREFGQATQLRLLSFPANWLAIAGLLGCLILGFRQLRQGDKETRRQETGDRMSIENDPVSPSPFLPFFLSLLAWIALYVLAISIGLAPQARFFLPLTPIYALAAAWAITRMRPEALPANTTFTRQYRSHLARSIGRDSTLLAGIVLLVLLWGGFASGTAYVTRVRTPSDDNAPGQPADEVAAAGLVLQTLHGDERLVLEPPRDSIDGLSLGKYSAIADRVVPAPTTDDLAALRATGAGYLLRATTLGPAPGDLPAVGSAGGYTLYTITR
jgi:4-amino-4-deoxy-L-arabinose transferase-like glycosyltransferase